MKTKDTVSEYQRGFDAGRAQGRKDMVKWIKEENDKNSQVLDGSFIIAKMNPERWQAQLKEWGIE